MIHCRQAAIPESYSQIKQFDGQITQKVFKVLCIVEFILQLHIPLIGRASKLSKTLQAVQVATNEVPTTR